MMNMEYVQMGFGLLEAGYNLQELVNADIVEHQSQYNIEK